MKTNKQPAAAPLPERITVTATGPYKFLDDVCAAYVQGYRVDLNGYLLMNIATSGFMVEMTLPQESAND